VVNDHGGMADGSGLDAERELIQRRCRIGSAAGVEAPGTVYTIDANRAYAVTESGGPSGYVESKSADCTIASAVLATSYTCTITNDDIQPKLVVIKHVVNDNGGTSVAGAFTMTVTGTDVVPSSGTITDDDIQPKLYVI